VLSIYKYSRRQQDGNTEVLVRLMMERRQSDEANWYIQYMGMIRRS